MLTHSTLKMSLIKVHISRLEVQVLQSSNRVLHFSVHEIHLCTQATCRKCFSHALFMSLIPFPLSQLTWLNTILFLIHRTVHINDVISTRVKRCRHFQYHYTWYFFLILLQMKIKVLIINCNDISMPICIS